MHNYTAMNTIRLVVLSTLLLLGLAPNFFSSAFSLDLTASKRTHESADIGERTSRIAIVGAGAVGSYYGGRIWESVRSSSKTDVMFQLRNENYD
jgi:hypothetical protein